MGSITQSFDPGNSRTLFTIVGEADAHEVLTSVLAFLQEAPTQQVLWDIRGGKLTALSTYDLKMIVDRAGPFTDVRAGGQTAIVVTREVDFGLCRMFQAFAEMAEVPFAILVARDIDEAQRWLGSEGLTSTT